MFVKRSEEADERKIDTRPWKRMSWGWDRDSEYVKLILSYSSWLEWIVIDIWNTIAAADN